MKSEIKINMNSREIIARKQVLSVEIFLMHEFLCKFSLWQALANSETLQLLHIYKALLSHF